MLETLNLNLCFFQFRAWSLVFLSLPATILKARSTHFLVLLRPLVDLLVADVVLEGCFSVVPAVGDAVFGDLNPFLHCGRTCFFHAAPS